MSGHFHSGPTVNNKRFENRLNRIIKKNRFKRAIHLEIVHLPSFPPIAQSVAPSLILHLLASPLIHSSKKGGRMGAKLSRKKSEVGIGAETTGPAVEETATPEDTPVAENAEQNGSEVEVPESKPAEEAPAAEKPASSTSVLQTITQAVGETVNAVTEQIAAPVEDVVNKGIEAMESALASVSLIGKEPATPGQEPVADLDASEVLQEPSLLDDLLKSPISEALITGVTVASEAITNEMVEDKISNPVPAKNKDLLECLDKVETPSLDLLDCKLTHESTIPNSDPSFTLEDMGQNAVDSVNLI